MSAEDRGAGHALFAADIAGTLIFAIEGAVAAVHGNLGLMGCWCWVLLRRSVAELFATF